MTRTDDLYSTDSQLRDLVNRAGDLTERADRVELRRTSGRAKSVWHTLTAARDMLDQIGVEYIDAARAYITAASKILTEIADEVERAEIVADHADRTTAADVLAWLDHNGIVIYSTQRRRIEAHL